MYERCSGYESCRKEKNGVSAQKASLKTPSLVLPIAYGMSKKAILGLFRRFLSADSTAHPASGT